MDIQDRVVGHRRVKASELKPHPKNWRKHSPDQTRAMKGILSEVGFVGSVIARELPDGSLELVDGHLRAEVAKNEKIPVSIIKLTDAEADLILATHDPIGAMAGKDEDILAELLDGMVPPDDEDLNTFLAGLLDLDLGPADGLTDADAVPEAPKEPITKPGDLWVLGDHRVLCGDSTNKEDVERLMGGEKADMVLTDPPYNIASDSKNYVAGSTQGPRGDVSKAMSELADADWDKNFDIVPAVLVMLSEMKKDASLYVFTSQFLIQKIWDTLYEAKMGHVSYCVWTKPNPMPCLSKRHWTWGTELCVYATRGRHTFNFPKEGHALNWWDVTKNSDGTHPTQKTIGVIERPMVRSSNAGDLVLDPFLGSSTTIIAAEQLGRRCYGMELSPAYCDVGVKRWEEFTGKTAVLETK